VIFVCPKHYLAVCNRCGQKRKSAGCQILREFTDDLHGEGWQVPPPYPNDNLGDLVRLTTLCPRCGSK